MTSRSQTGVRELLGFERASDLEYEQRKASMRITRRQATGALLCTPAVGSHLLAAEESPPVGLRVVSYNIRYDNAGDGPNRWQHRRQAMADYLAELKPDLAGLQEVLIGQLRFLAEKLPDYAWHGAGRDDGREQGELSPLLYRRERFEVRDKGTFWLSDTPDQVGSKGWDAALPRVCSWLKLFDKQAHRELLALNTHFDHRGREARRQSAVLLRRKIDSLCESAPTLPVILTGDFNCTASDEPYRALVAQTEATHTPLCDSLTISKKSPAGPDSTWNGFEGIVPKRIIDFIFVRNMAVLAHRVDDPRVEGRFVSDHLPVVAELRFAG
jgi:endonuclease/exonuclease/phosphatase family metal-dependent hydrolase